MKRHEKRKDAVLAWHFVNDNKTLGYDAANLTVEPGYIYYTDSPVILCESGLHASIEPFDALPFAPGSQLCRVAVWGDVKISNDKIAGRNREVLAMADVSSDLRLFACWCVRQVWSLSTDEHSRNAIFTAERYALGMASKEELAAARNAAWDAARDAARDAAWDAAWNAAMNAARNAAWDAARDAAWDAARDAAWNAAMNAQKTEFNRRIEEKFKENG